MLIGSSLGNATASNYYMIASTGAAIASEANANVCIPSAGTLKSMVVYASVSPGGATKSWTVTVRNNTDNTLMTVTITNAETTGTYTGDIDIAAGDNPTVYITSANSPAASVISWAITYETDTDGQQWLLGRGTGLNTSGSYIYVPLYTVAGGSSGQYLVFPMAGTLSNFRAELTVAPGEATARKFTFAINGSSKTLAKSADADDTAISDDANNVSINAGDSLQILSTVTGTPATGAFNMGVVFTPTDADTWLLAFSARKETVADTTYYLPINNYDLWQTTEASAYCYVPALKITNMYVYYPVAPGVGKSYTATLRTGGGDTSPLLAVDVSGATTKANASAEVSIVAASAIDIEVVPTGTPAATRLNVSLTVDSSPEEEPEEPTSTTSQPINTGLNSGLNEGLL